jgi:hypothetical protein
MELYTINLRLPSLSAMTPPGSWKRNLETVSSIRSMPRSSFVALSSRMKRLL